MFDSKLTPEDNERITQELERKIEPFDYEAIKNLACAVIYDSIKHWNNNLPGTTDRIKAWLRSADYRFWANMAGIDCDAETVICALERRGKVCKYDYMKEVV